MWWKNEAQLVSGTDSHQVTDRSSERNHFIRGDISLYLRLRYIAEVTE